MNTPCALALASCLPCNDDPIRNISAEDPDVDVFTGFYDFKGDPPLGIVYAQLGCKSICFSTTSQRDADDCALNQAQECTWNGWRNPPVPPIPPGPNDEPGGGGFNTPGGVPTSTPRSPIRQFTNTIQGCSVECPDGTPFIETVAAGTIRELSQSLANAKALALACKRANLDKICIVTDQLTSACVGDGYSFQFTATGGTTFSDGGYLWNVFGDLPPGISFDGGTGELSGIPTASGSYVFQIEVLDATDRETTKLFTLCVMEIVTAATLPQGAIGTAYSQPLIEQPGEVATEQWTLVTGELPPGITLAANGVLSGTPTTDGVYVFVLQVSANCP